MFHCVAYPCWADRYLLGKSVRKEYSEIDTVKIKTQKQRAEKEEIIIIIIILIIISNVHVEQYDE